MSLVEQVHEHPGEHYLDFEDETHSMAVFGIGVATLRHEVEVELEQLAVSAEPDN